MQDSTNEQERFFVDSVKELERVNKQLAKLVLRKEELTEQIISALEHDHEGQKSYEYGVWKIEVKTPFVYSLNKKLYESGSVNLPDDFNPIKESVSYSVDKRLCDKFMTDAPKKVRDALAELIDKKPGKAGITIKERV
ncbi:hypothetical protein UFOVP685_45 [uncultured Caudovirales phage]|uniref:Uncharacterized protein n=1 Tax=uncultured Caudovirales phage TaxID=2100421 RepID=A0A6J5N3K7_9CAUD|nr:hypothetical protein UFOVP590_39 [uncultured Caudovirales phage]CAB4157753.1 hypothetical protein UFOVP685_45 [uncultured Caudovirales phage]CAB5225305.1 hypothetical protein UFOVP750_7 [uncultured Caudovirales phage]